MQCGPAVPTMCLSSAAMACCCVTMGRPGTLRKRPAANVTLRPCGAADPKMCLRVSSAVTGGSGPVSLGSIWHYDGTTWTEMRPPDGSSAFQAVWGLGPKDVYVGGRTKESALLHYDGQNWTPVLDPTVTGTIGGGVVTNLWGTATGQLFAGLSNRSKLSALQWPTVDNARNRQRGTNARRVGVWQR